MEILYKAKRTDNGKWITGGSIIQFFDNGERTVFIGATGEKCICTHDEDENIIIFEECMFYKVDPETVCVYIGLKDKNKKKIFENDILRLANGAYLRVSWHTFKASWVISKKGWLYNHFFGEAVDPEDVEVVGNVFGNPELLERTME